MDDLKHLYIVHEKIGAGSFGEVYRCTDRETSDVIAIKKIPIWNKAEGVPAPILREVSVLQDMHHENVVRLLSVTINMENVYLAFEYVEMDMHSYITNQVMSGDPIPIKNFLQQILRGVAYCHSHDVIHRDLKPSNLLIDVQSNTVKLADFGSAREYIVPQAAYTIHVGTRFYEAPELQFNDPRYSTAVDIWAVGCIVGEMVMGEPLFRDPCSSPLSAIFDLLGTPTEETWPGVTLLCPSLLRMPKKDPQDLEKKFSNLGLDGVDLLSKMLCLNPNKRISADEALEHDYFKDVQNLS